MDLIKKILSKFNGLHYRQEYLCLAKETFQNPIHAYLVKNDKVIKDVTELHLLVGYCPLIVALSSSTCPVPESQIIEIALSQRSLNPNENLPGKDAIALLSLKRIHQFDDEKNSIAVYEGVKGHHHFVSRLHQSIIQLNNRLYNKKQGNIFLDSNLYKQVQIAYAVPRQICLVTVGGNNLFNLFPTDLHGKINEHYLMSLRHEGNACKQVESSKKIIISNIQASAYRRVYGLGKNHMQPLKEKSSFDFSTGLSKKFNLPLPKDVLSYYELELENSFTHGIHKLLVFRINSGEKVSDEPATLAHIHNSYATWRYKNRISSNLLLR